MNKWLPLFILINLWLSACGNSSVDQQEVSESIDEVIISPSESTIDKKNQAPLEPGFGGSLSTQDKANINLTLDANNLKQTMESFGASDAWSIQHVGKWRSAPDIAELLFSTGFDDSHNPKGIGLSLWRFNIGAGSAGQNNINDYWRRSETFLRADGTYDWSRQQGQQQFLQLAKAEGVEDFVAFANSPPRYLTKNGNAFGDGGSSSNLAANQIDHYAQYLVDIWLYFAKPDGPNIVFDYLSPVNEPQWDWAQSNGQEGNPYTNDEIATLTKALDDAISKNGISTKIELPEAAQLNFFYESHDLRGNQLDAFFSEASANQVGNLTNVARNIAGHSYFTTWPISTLITTRQQLAQKLKSYPELTFSMSEYCLLEDNQEVAGSRDIKGLSPALYTARVIHHDLTIANANSWQWWLAVSPYDYNDGLIYVGENEEQGYQHSKTLWALGQYSRFIRPGMKRISLYRDDQQTLEEQAESLMASAYQDEVTGQTVVVLINYSNQQRVITTQFLNESHAISTWVPYVTSSSDDMTAYAAIDAKSSVKIPARSIVTLVSTPAIDDGNTYSLMYFVNAGENDALPPSSHTMNTFADQTLNKDPISGLLWGYENSPTWSQNDGESVWDSLRTDEQHTPGKGLIYRFELPEVGDYKVVLGLYDPWENSSRMLDIIINEQSIESGFQITGQTIRSAELKLFSGEVTIEILRSEGNTGSDDDPLLSWIQILKKEG